MKLQGWGKFPVIESKSLLINRRDELKISPFKKSEASVIAYGNGRSYGDSALADYHIPMRTFNRFLNFDSHHGLLTCEPGVLLSEIIEVFLPRGWFLKITPGTKLITVGGAVASDVHGKNHHKQGCFSNSVKSLKLILPNEREYVCSESENTALFRATCGGMGLTGIISEVTLQLKKVNSQWINQKTIPTKNLEDTFEAFEKYADEPYSVAWIDTLAKGNIAGRSVLMTGDFSSDGDLNYKASKKINIPFNAPSFLLNKLTSKSFNWLYYNKSRAGKSEQTVSVDTFFYPLDAISNWNRIYGKNGFVQFQFILPKRNSFEGLRNIVNKISESRYPSYLAVLKLYGPENKNYLSFPLEGYSLALDFKVEKGLIEFLRNLSREVQKYDGRIYLAKDAIVEKEIFEKGYSKIQEFRDFRSENGLKRHLNSLQSIRLDL